MANVKGARQSKQTLKLKIASGKQNRTVRVCYRLLIFTSRSSSCYYLFCFFVFLPSVFNFGMITLLLSQSKLYSMLKVYLQYYTVKQLGSLS